MKSVKYETTEEKKMIMGIQNAFGAKADGVLGNQTLSDIARAYCPNIFPLTLELYGMPMIISKDCIPFDPNGPISVFDNTMSGSFTYPRCEKPCSILISSGNDICSCGSKAWAGFKESVIVRYYNGDTKIVRVSCTPDIPNRKDVKWAVGGMGLIDNFDPNLEGYRKFTFEGKPFNHGDVLRDTDHTVLGVKGGFCYLILCKSMTGYQVNDFCKNKLKLDMAVMLDGGEDIPAINGAESFARINVSKRQGYAIQAI